jgi:hypothetical protein
MLPLVIQRPLESKFVFFKRKSFLLKSLYCHVIYVGRTHIGNYLYNGQAHPSVRTKLIIMQGQPASQHTTVNESV